MKLYLLLAFPLFAQAAIWPESIGPYKRGTVSVPKLADAAIWDEYGLKESETAVYEQGKQKFTVTGYRLQDTTGAMAAFEWQRPADARESDLAPLAARTAKDLILAHGNYLLYFKGFVPSAEELNAVLNSFLSVDATPLPNLPAYFPAKDLVPNSDRYILGPASLAKFDAGIPPSVAAFHLGTEAQIGVFHNPKGDLTLALFNYPTPQIAMQKVSDFEKLPGTVAKRSGPLVAVILAPADADAAERLLAQVRYEVQITLNERVPRAGENAGTMLLNIFILTGILIVFCVIAGLFVGGFRTVLLGRRKGADADPMILLHLEQR
jgi:hypothetical protein